MDVKKYLDISPTLLTIAPTYKCTAKCTNCCFRCTPQIEHILDSEKIIKYIDEAVESFKSIKGVVFTGGECFLIGEELARLVKHATSHGLLTRVVSNGYWANSYERAIEKLTPLIKAGLKEINFSTGDNHQEYVPFENIVNGLKAAYSLGVRSMCVSVESSSNTTFNSSDIRGHIYLAPMISEGVLTIADGAWMQFQNKHVEKTIINPFQNLQVRQPCKNIFTNIFITPHSQMLACCGITVEYNKYLKLGNIENNSMLDLYNNQLNDLFKFWLYVDGPAIIYDKIMNFRDIKTCSTFNHACGYCLEIIKDEENIETIEKIIEAELPGIIYRYKIRNTNFKLI